MNTKNKLLLLLIALPFLLISFSFNKIKKEIYIKKVKTIQKISPQEENVFWYSVPLWQGLAKRQIVIGPFVSQEQALNSRMLYKRSADKIDNIRSVQPPPTVYWFAVSFKNSERLRVYIFERTPANVQSGTTEQFVAALYEQLGFQKFSIGPFWDYERAEMAKALYRKNE